MAPGKRDAVTIRSDTGKEKVQKRHLYMSIKETWNLFKEENPTTKIGLTKFGYVRPEHVRFSSETPANMCTCIYHQNVVLALSAMHKYLPEIPLYSKSFAEGCLVSSDEKCWYDNCDHNTCSFDSTYKNPQHPDDPAKWVKKLMAILLKIKKVVRLVVYTITWALYFQIFSYMVCEKKTSKELWRW